MVWIRCRSVRLVGALVLVALATRAEAGAARVRWNPSTDDRVVGYHVYMRNAGTPYGTPLDAGKPAPAADGSLAYDVSGLTTGQTYYFAVAGYSSDGVESGISHEKALGTVNPCMIDSCSTQTACDIHVASDGSSCDDGLFCNGLAVCQGGVCQNGPPPDCSDGVACTVDSCDETLARCVHTSQPGCCQTDADCVDNDACTTGERCKSGTCTSLATICPSSECAEAFCDPQSGCGLKPTPDGVSCSSVCDVLTPKRFVLRYDPDGVSYSLRAMFQSSATIDPTSTGFSLEVADATGVVVYAATVPAPSITTKNMKKFYYLPKGDEALATAGLSGMTLKVHDGKWTLKTHGIASALVGAMQQPQLALTVRFDTACARDTSVMCDGGAQRSSCR